MYLKKQRDRLLHNFFESATGLGVLTLVLTYQKVNKQTSNVQHSVFYCIL